MSVEREVPETELGGIAVPDVHMPGPLVRRMLLIAVLAVALAGAATAWVVERASGREVQERLMRQQTDEVELVARLLASKIEQSQKVLSSMADGITPTMLESPSLLEWMLQQGLPAVRFFDSMEIARTDGRLVLNLQNGKMEPAADIDSAERDMLLRTMVQGKPMVSGVLGKSASDARIMFTLPLVSEEEGKPGGVAAGVLRLQSQGLLPHSLGLPAREDSRLIVFNSDGVILSHPQLERVMGDVKQEPGLGAVYASWQADPKPIANGRGESLVTQDRLVSLAGVSMPQWWVARVTDASLWHAPLEHAQRRAWWLAAACILAISLVAALMMALVARPFTELHRRARSILMSQSDDDAKPTLEEESVLLNDALDHLESQQLHHGQRAEFSRLQLQGILEQAPTGIVITRNDTLELLSQQASLMLGYSRKELEGESALRLFADEAHYTELVRQMREGAMTRGVYEGEFALKRKDGSLLWARVAGRTALDRVNVVPALAAVWVLEDITRERDEREQPLWGRSHDALTNLPNRVAFDERVAALLARQPSADAGLALLFIDLDHFTLVNDRLGHEAGDTLLRQFASLLEELVRHVGWAARLGGDEFAVVLPDCSAERAELIAEHVRASIEEWEFSFDGQTTQTTVSIGIVVVPPGQDDIMPWLRTADMACYYAKRAGRNRIMQREMSERTTTTGSLS